MRSNQKRLQQGDFQNGYVDREGEADRRQILILPNTCVPIYRNRRVCGNERVMVLVRTIGEICDWSPHCRHIPEIRSRKDSNTLTSKWQEKIDNFPVTVNFSHVVLGIGTSTKGPTGSNFSESRVPLDIVFPIPPLVLSTVVDGNQEHTLAGDHRNGAKISDAILMGVLILIRLAVLLFTSPQLSVSVPSRFVPLGHQMVKSRAKHTRWCLTGGGEVLHGEVDDQNNRHLHVNPEPSETSAMPT